MNRRTLLGASASVLALSLSGPAAANLAMTARALDPRLALIDMACMIAASHKFSIADTSRMLGIEPYAFSDHAGIKGFALTYLPRDMFERATYVIEIEKKRREGRDRISRYGLDEPHPNLGWKTLRQVLTTGTRADLWHAAIVYGCDIESGLD